MCRNCFRRLGNILDYHFVDNAVERIYQESVAEQVSLLLADDKIGSAYRHRRKRLSRRHQLTVEVEISLLCHTIDYRNQIIPCIFRQLGRSIDSNLPAAHIALKAPVALRTQLETETGLGCFVEVTRKVGVEVFRPTGHHHRIGLDGTPKRKRQPVRDFRQV